MSDEQWREAIADILEDAEFREDVDIIMTGLVAFNAICNSYPQVEIDDVIAAVASHVWVALNVRKLVEQGQLEEYKGPDGKTNYRRVPDSDQIRIVK
jgi:hypothetical protein